MGEESCPWISVTKSMPACEISLQNMEASIRPDGVDSLRAALSWCVGSSNLHSISESAMTLISTTLAPAILATVTKALAWITSFLLLIALGAIASAAAGYSHLLTD
jgi:hypothetical protein